MAYSGEFELDMDADPLGDTGLATVKLAIARFIHKAVADSGDSVSSICSKAGISRTMYYNMLEKDLSAVLHISDKIGNNVSLGKSVVKMLKVLGVDITVNVRIKNGKGVVTSYSLNNK